MHVLGSEVWKLTVNLGEYFEVRTITEPLLGNPDDQGMDPAGSPRDHLEIQSKHLEAIRCPEGPEDHRNSA